MSDISFGATVGMLKNAMDGAGSRTASSPTTSPTSTRPTSGAATSRSRKPSRPPRRPPGDPDELALTTASDRHIAIGGPQDAQPFAISTTVDDTQQMRVDGSNVDVDQEMAKLSLNSSYAQTMGQMLQNQYTRLHNAITERA